MIVMFFVFKQKTAYEMRISDWSSDVCSSDLVAKGGGISLKFEQELSFGDFVSISAWRKSQYDARFDNDYTPDPWIRTNIIVDEEQYSQEFQISGGAASAMQWTTGAYFFEYIDRKSTRLNSSH